MPSIRALAPLVKNPRFVSLWIASFVLGTLNAPILSLLAVYVEAEIGGTPLLSAGLRSTFLLLGGVFAVSAGLACDRIGTRNTFVLGATGTLVSGIVFFVHQPQWLFVLCLYIGGAMGFSTTAGQAYLIRAVPRSHLGLGSAAFFLGMTLGNALGSRLAGRLVDGMGFSSIGFGIIGMMILVLPALLAFMPPGATSGHVPGAPPRTPVRAYAALLRRTDIRLLLSIRFLPTCYWGTATLLIPLLVFRAAGAVSSAANYAALSLVVASVFQVVIGRVCDAIGPKKPTLTASVCVAVSALCTGLFADSVTGLYVFGITGAASAWSVSTMMPRIIHAVAEREEQGRVVGLAHFAWSLGMLSGSLWGGRAVEWNAGLPFYGVTVGCVLAVVSLARLFRRLDAQ